MSTKIYMTFGDIKGDVNDSKHQNWIELESCCFSVNRSVSQETGTSRRNIGNPTINGLKITKKMNLSTQQIFSELIAGSGQKCVIHFVGDKSNVFMAYTLENALISHYDMNFSKGEQSSFPMENLEISFTRLESVYTPLDSAGKPGSPRSAGYDLSLAKKL